MQTTAFVVAAVADCPRQRLAPSGHRLLHGAVEFLLSRQDARGAFFEAGEDRTLLAVLALAAYQSSQPGDHLRPALLLLPTSQLPVGQTPVGDTSDRALIAAAIRVHQAYAPPPRRRPPEVTTRVF